MHQYETVFIVSPRLADEETVSVISGVRKFLEEKSSQILQEKDWGKKRFAYPIRKFDEGHYVMLRFNTPDSKTPQELERFYRLNEQILRFLIIKAE